MNWTLRSVLVILATFSFATINAQINSSNSSTTAPSSTDVSTNTSVNLTTAAQQQNPYVNNPGTVGYPGLLGQFLPSALSALNPAEQQLSPLQLQNASPQQLAQLRRLQQLRALQRQQQGLGGFPGVDLIGSFLPGMRSNAANARNGLNNANNNNNNNRLTSGNPVNANAYNPYAGGLGQLLGLTPSAQPGIGNANPLGLGLGQSPNRNGMIGLNPATRLYGQPTPVTTPAPVLANQMAQPEDDSGENGQDGEAAPEEGGGEGDAGAGEGAGGEGEGNANGDEGQNNAADPSQDPDMKQFSNLQGGENFPSDLFPPGILSENDLKDIQKSMDEQAKKEAEEKQRQQAEQEANEGDGNGEEGNAGEGDAGNENAGNGEAEEDPNAVTEANDAGNADLPTNPVTPKMPTRSAGYIPNDAGQYAGNSNANYPRGGTINALSGYSGNNYQPPATNQYGSLPVTNTRPSLYNPPSQPPVNANPYAVNPLRSDVQYENERDAVRPYDRPATRPAYGGRYDSNRGDSLGRTADAYPPTNPTVRNRYDDDIRYQQQPPADNRDPLYDNRPAYGGNSRTLDDPLYDPNPNTYDDLRDRNRLDNPRTRMPIDRYNTPTRAQVDSFGLTDPYSSARGNDRTVDQRYSRPADRSRPIDRVANTFPYSRANDRTADDYGRGRDSGAGLPRGYSYGSLGRRPYDAHTADQSAQVASEGHKDVKAKTKSTVQYTDDPKTRK